MNLHRLVALFILPFSLLSPSFLFAQNINSYPVPHVEGWLIAKIKPEFRQYCSDSRCFLPQFDTISDQLQITRIKKVFPALTPPVQLSQNSSSVSPDLTLLYYVEYKSDIAAAIASKKLAFHEAFAYVEPWYVHQTFYQPNDPFADTVAGFDRMWYLDLVQAREAWDIQRNNENIIIGCIDSGFSLQHEDSKGNIWLNVEDPPDGLDNDNDGYIDNFSGWDLAGSELDDVGDNDPSFNPDAISSFSHGEAVASVPCAVTDNGVGIAGIAFNSKYIPIKAASDAIPGAILYGYQGIIYAVEQGAQIVNCSWGNQVRSQFGEDIINYATITRQAGVIAACGNSRSRNQFYPAAYNNVVSVANTFLEDIISASSTYDYTVDVCAPGTGVFATLNDEGYRGVEGTSFASPFASGVAAVILSYFENYSGFQAAQRMRVTTDDIYAVNDSSLANQLGTGRVNMLKGLTDPSLPSIRILQQNISSQSGRERFISGDTISIQLDFINYLDATESLSVKLSSLNRSEHFTWIKDSLYAGQIGMMESFSTGLNPFKLALEGDIPIDTELIIRLDFKDQSSGYTDAEYISLIINPGYIDISVNELQTSMSARANYGFHSLDSEKFGLGVRYASFENALFEGGFLVSQSPLSVSDNIRNGNGTDEDFKALTQITESVSTDLESFQAGFSFNDINSPSPLGLDILQDSYAFTGSEEDDFVIFRYIFHNPGSEAIEDIYSGLFADWDIAPVLENNVADFDSAENLVYAYHLNADAGFYGLRLLDGHNFLTFATKLSSPFNYSDEAKYMALTQSPDSIASRAGFEENGDDIMQFISTGPFSLQAGQRDTIAFALVAALSKDSLIQHSRNALHTYRCKILGEGPVQSFSASSDTVLVGQSILFSDQNAGSNSWAWDFGDGNTAENMVSVGHEFDTPGTYTVSLEVKAESCLSIHRQQIQVNLATFNEEIYSPELKVFPNPGSGIFNIETGISLGEMKVNVYNTIGGIVWSGMFEKGKTEFQINIETQPSGLYWLVLEGDDIYLRRIISRY